MNIQIKEIGTAYASVKPQARPDHFGDRANALLAFLGTPQDFLSRAQAPASAMAYLEYEAVDERADRASPPEKPCRTILQVASRSARLGTASNANAPTGFSSMAPYPGCKPSPEQKSELKRIEKLPGGGGATTERGNI
jgi:hypothetical protein